MQAAEPHGGDGGSGSPKRFRYIADHPIDGRVSGFVDAPTLEAARAILTAQGVRVVSIGDAPKRPSVAEPPDSTQAAAHSAGSDASEPRQPPSPVAQMPRVAPIQWEGTSLVLLAILLFLIALGAFCVGGNLALETRTRAVYQLPVADVLAYGPLPQSTFLEALSCCISAVLFVVAGIAVLSIRSALLESHRVLNSLRRAAVRDA